MFRHEDTLKIDNLKNSFNFAVFASQGSERFTNLCFVSPMVYVRWHVGSEFIDLCNDPENIDRIKYRLDLKLFVSSRMNTKKTENLRANPFVSVLLAKVDTIDNTCSQYLNIWGKARIFESKEKENVWNKFLKYEKSTAQNYFQPFEDEKDICMIMIEAESCMFHINGNVIIESISETGG